MKKTSIKSFNVVSYNFFHSLITVLAKDTGGSSQMTAVTAVCATNLKRCISGRTHTHSANVIVLNGVDKSNLTFQL